jgi:hypothetical protein
MSEPIFRAFVLCDEITDTASGPHQKDLRGAGLEVIRTSGPFPFKRTFWVYIEVAGEKASGKLQLALMRADSGRRLFFRPMTIEFPDQLHTVLIAVRVFDCIFPAPGVFFLELWYDDEWRIDQRFEVI